MEWTNTGAILYNCNTPVMYGEDVLVATVPTGFVYSRNISYFYTGDIYSLPTSGNLYYFDTAGVIPGNVFAWLSDDLIISFDGITWTVMDFAYEISGVSFIESSFFTGLIATDYNGEAFGSVDGTTWNYLFNFPEDNSISNVACSSSVCVAASTEYQTIFTTPAYSLISQSK